MLLQSLVQLIDELQLEPISIHQYHRKFRPVNRTQSTSYRSNRPYNMKRSYQVNRSNRSNRFSRTNRSDHPSRSKRPVLSNRSRLKSRRSNRSRSTTPQINQFASFVRRYEHVPTLAFLEILLHNVSMPSSSAFIAKATNRKGRTRSFEQSTKAQRHDSPVQPLFLKRMLFEHSIGSDEQESSYPPNQPICDDPQGNCYSDNRPQYETNQYITSWATNDNPNDYESSSNDDSESNDNQQPDNYPPENDQRTNNGYQQDHYDQDHHPDQSPPPPPPVPPQPPSSSNDEEKTEISIPGLPIKMNDIISFIRLTEMFLKKKTTYKVVSSLLRFVVRLLIPLSLKFKKAAFKCFLLAVPLDLLLVPLGIITGLNPLLMPFAPLAMIIIGLSKLFASTICFLLAF